MVHLPNSSKKKVRSFKMNQFQILRNDKDIQTAIINNTCYAISYQKEVNLKLNNGKNLHMPQPSAYIANIQSRNFLVNSF